MGILGRLRNPIRSTDDQSPRPSPSQVTPPSLQLHHHLQRPTRLLSSANLEFQELLGTQPARVGLNPSDQNGLGRSSPLLIWKNCSKLASPPSRNSKQTNTFDQSTMSTTSLVPSHPLSPGPFSTHFSHSTISVQDTSIRRPRGSISPTSTDRTCYPLSPTSPLAPSHRGLSQASPARSHQSPARNIRNPGEFNLQHSLNRHPLQKDFAVFTTQKLDHHRAVVPDNRQLASAASALDLLKFYQEVDRPPPSPRRRKHSLPAH